MESGNLFAAIPSGSDAEDFHVLARGVAWRLERIVSTGQATPEGEWYDQNDCEWVVLLRGSAGIRVEGEAETRTLGPGDWLHIPAHLRHRVDWTAADGPTVWLALHHDAAEA
ncbi:MAG: cupin domain-containing protein [Alphaproteobacteria bacterium]|jgi:cupin 2 domain-containing protein|nr:cupin domain-containing protein [Alphaproteobacteria bacterium]